MYLSNLVILTLGTQGIFPGVRENAALCLLVRPSFGPWNNIPLVPMVGYI